MSGANGAVVHNPADAERIESLMEAQSRLCVGSIVVDVRRNRTTFESCKFLFKSRAKNFDGTSLGFRPSTRKKLRF
jgi:hypothetical protein